MKNYLIVGASSGIGKALAEQLPNEGHHVYGTYNHNKKQETQNINYYQLDTTSEFDLDFLPNQLDGLVYCPKIIHVDGGISSIK